MIPDPIQPALSCPYTLIEEEALAWSLLLCKKALLLHPFPLSLPPSYLSLLDQGVLQVRTLKRTQEEIHLKDRTLRAIQAFIAGNPDQAFLKTLNKLTLGEDLETQEELVGLLKGGPFKKTSEGFSAIDGQTLLCLIHEWMMQEWELEASLARIGDQEKSLALSWQENKEETTTWQSPDSILQRNETEIPCPRALTAWRELKNRLVPEPSILFTTQRWIWADHYGLDPEEEQAVSIPLPDLGPLRSSDFQKLMDAQSSSITGAPPLKDLEGLLPALMGPLREKSIGEFQKTLAGLSPEPKGRYDLILPPINFFLKGPMGRRDPNEADPLVLLSPRATLFT